MDVSVNGKFQYSIYIEKDFSRLKEVVSGLDTADRRGLIVTDSNVGPIYLEEVERILKSCFRETGSIILEAGEEHKNLLSVNRIYEKALSLNMDRKDYFIALGGGVTGDMTGFAAATYMRGIKFIQIPTTILAQVDSSIGGKTGVDFGSYKNMVGAFHNPSLVYSSVGSIKTLPKVQLASGMGEVIKHGLIKSRAYGEFLYENIDEIMALSPDLLIETVKGSNLIKREVVEEDPTEKGIRQILNFGHTLGHAIEKFSEFSYTHGQCVAFGMLAAMKISGISEEEMEKTREIIEKSGLLLKPDIEISDIPEIINITHKDKKMDSGHVKFILLREAGEAYIDTSVTDDIMARALLDLIS